MKKRVKLKQWMAVVLSIVMLAVMMPQAAFASTKLSGKFVQGAVRRSSDGSTYQFSKSEAGYISIYYYSTATGKVETFSGQYDGTEPKRSYLIKSDDGTTYKGYCVEHGMATNEDRKLSALSENEVERLIYTGLSKKAKQNLELALLYGYQDGDSTRRLETSVKDGGLGFNDSKYYNKTSKTGYNTDDWYMATQCLIWEIQQRNRTDDMERVTNNLGVSANHYLSIISGRPAVDIYNWMVSCIKNHYKFPTKLNGLTEKHPAVIHLTKEHKVEGGYRYTFTDSTKLGLDYAVLTQDGKSLKNDKITITYDEDSKKYTIHIKGEPNDTGYMVKHAFDGQKAADNLLYYCWYSDGSHVQSIATGAADPVMRYVKFVVDEETETPDEPEEGLSERPEPEFFPEFEFPVRKMDANPGWDGDQSTGMGDASLAATYTLYRAVNGGSWQAVDSVTLDEFGSTQYLHDQPWRSLEDLHLTTSNPYTHEITSGDPPATSTHCNVPDRTYEWTASVSWKIVETRPDGRFIEPDDGIRDTYTASYYAVTNNSQNCMDDPEHWSEMEYRLRYANTSGTGGVQGADETLEGTYGENGIENGTVYAFSEETFLNDCDRGRLFLSKSNESENVFEEEGSSGAQSKSTRSKWKMYLKSGGWEDHPYLRFVDEGLKEEGTHFYRAVRDTSGNDNAVTDLEIGTNGCLYVYDIPYGTYIVEEVAADDTSYVLESFEQFIGENAAEHNGAVSGGDVSHFSPYDSKTYDNRYDWNLRDKKKENVIKVIKTDAETGKPVSAEHLSGAKFYIRYMGSPLNSDAENKALKNYGRLLPNAADINSTSKDDTFQCNENGEIVIPYDLEFGIYRLEEWLLPEGYFVGEYDASGRAKSHSYAALAEGQTKVLEAADTWNQLVTIYDEKGNPVRYEDSGSYKRNEIFNYYTFQVTRQDGHMDGQEYMKYYQAVAMPNNPVKGKIAIEKQGEFLTGFIETIKNGIKVWTPQYALDKLKGAVFGIFAAEDITLNDGNDGPAVFDSDTGEKITIPTEISTHSGDHSDGAIYDEGTLHHESGAKLYFRRERDQAEDNHYYRVYTTPEQKPTTYRYTYTKTENGLHCRYDVSVKMEYKAGGKNVTDVDIIKTTSAADGDVPSLEPYRTVPYAIVGEIPLSEVTNFESTAGNILDAWSNTDTYEADGEDGNFVKLQVQEYRVTYTQQGDNEEGFLLNWDGIEITSKAALDQTASTTISSPFAVTPDISLGIGYRQKTEGNQTTFTAKEPYAPVYFLSRDGVKTEMYYFGGLTKTILTIPMTAAEGNYADLVPTILYGDQVIDWYTPLTPDTPVYTKELQANVRLTSERQEGGNGEDVSYTVTMLSNQTADTGDAGEAAEQRPFSIRYADGYKATISCGTSAEGNGIGIMELDGIDRTTRYALSDLVETITTGEDGKAVSSALPLGTYIIRELSAPAGFAADTEASWEVQLKYKDQFTPLVWEKVQSANRYFKVELDLSKVFETGYQTEHFVSGGGAVFGLYNAESISYEDQVLAADTCIDVITVGESGRALAEAKIPEGVYYLKEIRTRDGYFLNETPFYFAIGDGTKSAPLDISKDAEGMDFDGVTAKAVMDGHGRATITIDVLKQEPQPQLTVNSESQVKTVSYSDKTRYLVEVTEDRPANLILPNGRALTLTVTGNTYQYAYDGTEGQYIPTAVNTGYFATYTLKAKQKDENDPEDQTVTLTGACGSSFVTAVRVQEETCSVNVAFSGEAQALHLALGESLQKKAADGQNYIVKLDSEGNLTVSVSGILDGTLSAEIMPTAAVNGVLQTEDLKMYRSVTMARQDSAAKTVQVKINTSDDLNAGDIENLAKDIPQGPDIPWTPTPDSPSIGTTAVDSDTAEHIANADSQVTILDTVAYHNLIPKKEYKLIGTLMRKASGEALLIDGKPVTAETVFTPDTASGTVEMTFTFDGRALVGDAVVVFERLFEMTDFEKPVAKHEDITEEGQTVRFPEIGTSAADGADGDKTAAAGQEVTIVDTVRYDGLLPGKTYVMCGTLMEQESGKPLMENGRKITAEQIFRPQSEEGSVEMTFRFDGSKLGGRNVVVFETLYLLVDTDGDGTCDAKKQVAGHEDIHDAGQTVKLEKPDTPDQPQKPAGPETPAKVPKTGDTTGGMIYLALMAFSMVLFAVMMACERIRRRKGGKNEMES